MKQWRTQQRRCNNDQVPAGLEGRQYDSWKLVESRLHFNQSKALPVTPFRLIFNINTNGVNASSQCWRAFAFPCMTSSTHLLYPTVNKRVRPLRGRPPWGRPCSCVCACCFGAFQLCARRQGILTPPAKYQVDRTTGGEVMGIFRQQCN